MTISTNSQDLIRLATLAKSMGFTTEQTEAMVNKAAQQKAAMPKKQAKTNKVSSTPLQLASELPKPDKKTPNTKPVSDANVQRIVDAVKAGNKLSEQFSYRELQKACGVLNVKASGSRDVLVARLSDYRNPDNQKKAQAKRVNRNGMSYREAQRVVKWAKDNLVGYTSPCKNVGTDNVFANVDAIYESAHFWTIVNGDNVSAQEEMKALGLSW